ncbi:unnamed protein product [Ranitomeya imitator]|uniref:G-protein coupled receptors family 1 profile domain-containing protein n=1 Tax=Ranitomeya imitator TaxID=111125 RepID=A0ABN9KQM9_9NEOB|nr:unnamed protein product [Ranitomeya imitator]
MAHNLQGMGEDTVDEMAEVVNGLNISYISEFRLLGFPLVHQAKIVLFVVLLSIYLFTITSNVIIIYLVKFDHHLHKPMYFFLANFSFLEIWYISVTVPKMLSDFLDQDRKISRAGCLTQFYFFFSLNFLLVLISFDRYIAICHPLQYFTIMTEKFCRLLAVGAWTASIIAMICVTIPVSRLTFCGSNEIDHVFCDFSPLVKLSCNGAMLSKFTYFLAGVVMIGCFALIMISYVHIIVTVIATSSISELQIVLATRDIVPVYQIKGISKLFKLCLPKVQCFCDSLTSPPSERQRLQFKTLTMTYKAIHNLSPPYICDMVSRYLPTRNLRSSQDLLLYSPLISSSHNRIQDFSRACPILWNSLPQHIRLSPTIETFKKNLKTHLFRQAYSLQ